MKPFSEPSEFNGYRARVAVAIKDILERGLQLNALDTEWLSQFGPPELTTCQRLIDGYAVLQVTERLAKHTSPV